MHTLKAVITMSVLFFVSGISSVKCQTVLIKLPLLLSAGGCCVLLVLLVDVSILKVTACHEFLYMCTYLIS